MKRGILALAMFFGCLSTARAGVDERYFALVVGYNGPPVTADSDVVAPLRYADDDALSFYELEHEAGSDAVLLTVPDADSRRRFPWAAGVARPPTMSEIDQAVSDLNKRMDAAARAGLSPTFLLFFSGHGSRSQNT